MNGKNNNLTILVVSYDGYKDLWPDFFKCKRENWPDCPYETVLSNNSEPFSFENVRVINCGDDALWSQRTIKALENIKTKYVLFMLEDFYISRPVDTSLVEGIIGLMQREGIKYYKLLTILPFRTPKYKRFDHLHVIPANYKYGISLMAAVWDTEFLKEKVGSGNYNPWKFESDRNCEALNADKRIVGVYDKRNVLNICHMVVQGKYLPEAVRRMRRLGYGFINLSRPIMYGKEYWIYRMTDLYYSVQHRIPWINWFFKPLYKRFSISSKNK